MKIQLLIVVILFVLCVLGDVQKNKKTKKKIKAKPQADAPLPTRQGDDYIVDDANYPDNYEDEKEYYEDKDEDDRNNNSNNNGRK